MWNQTHPNNGSITTRLSYFFQRSSSALATRGKTKAILWCNWNPKLSPIRTIKDKSRCIDVPLFITRSFFFSFLNKLEHVPRLIRNESIFSIIFFSFFFFHFIPRRTSWNVSISIYLSCFVLFSFLSFIFFFFSFCFFFSFFLDRAVLWTVTESMSVIPKMFPTSIHTI